MRKDFWIRLTAGGLYCEPGDFFIDPWCPVERALITHAHSDHVRKGCKSYFTAEQNILLLRHRLGSASIEGLPWGVRKNVNGVEVSFHPSGHIRGAAQIRLAYRGEVCVITGDYKRHPDPTTTCFEPLRAHVLISESTFGLPMYRWSEPVHVIEEIGRWWATCRAEGKNAILFVYSLGKAQRLLATLPPIGPVYVYDSIAAVNQLYEREGVSLLPWQPLSKWWNKKERYFTPCSSCCSAVQVAI
ncbi:MAG: MBL fold metallo-hydrolase [Bacteroidia bacterium]|nr:MBL fold metallo-hydrolase [Bacteroidia bacterium]